jgi:hypothetical protein
MQPCDALWPCMSSCSCDSTPRFYAPSLIVSITLLGTTVTTPHPHLDISINYGQHRYRYGGTTASINAILCLRCQRTVRPGPCRLLQ